MAEPLRLGERIARQQIKQAADGYVVKDDIEYAFRNMIPLWMFGFILLNIHQGLATIIT